jgi:hypothetical protein
MVSTKSIASSDHRALFPLRCHRCAARQRASKSICHGEFPESTRARASAQGGVYSGSAASAFNSVSDLGCMYPPVSVALIAAPHMVAIKSAASALERISG